MTVKELITTLSECDLSKVAHHKIQKEILDCNIQLPITTSIIKKGAIIQRGRVSQKGIIYSSEFEISYRTDKENITNYGRANRPFQSMFYGAMPSKEIPYPTMTLFEELVEQFREMPEENFETTMTVGHWVVKEDIEIADVCFSKSYLGVNENNERFNHWDEKIIDEETRQLLLFFSDLFSRKDIENNSDYKITSVFTDFVLAEKLQGISYPSVKADYKSKNIVLTPSAVDKYLNLTEATVFKYIVDNGKPCVIRTRYSSKLGHLNSCFEWRELSKE